MAESTNPLPPASGAPPSYPGVEEWLNTSAGLASLGKTKDALGALWAGVEELTKLHGELARRVAELERRPIVSSLP